MGVYPPKDIADAASASCGASLRPSGAPVASVEPGSPADDAGFAPGCYVTHVDGSPVRDIIDWRWLAADDEIEVGYVDTCGDAGTVVLERAPGEPWGFGFDGAVFDGVKQCRNACTFCFMRQLPANMRPSLSLRDDDFRLSFLSGTFVTFTNLSAADEARILEQRISPLRVSLHAVDAQVRRRLIGRHAQHGLDALERLLAGGIGFHAQIVLLPGENDGEVLRETLEWAYARPGILNVGIVPLGFTGHQSAFDRSFNDPADARAVLDLVRPFQERACAERGAPWVFAADELYRNAYGEDLLEHLPPAGHYGDFALFEDGIGIIRSFVDDWRAAERDGTAARCAKALAAAGLRARFVVGGAMQPFLGQLVAAGPLAGALEPLTVRNGYFGGNVDVTGLLCGCDIAAAVREQVGASLATGMPEAPHQASSARAETSCGRFARAQDCLSDWGASGIPQRGSCANDLFAVPRVVLNDDGLTLDDMTLEDMEKAAGAPLAVVSCNPSEFLPELAALAARAAQS